MEFQLTLTLGHNGLDVFIVSEINKVVVHVGHSQQLKHSQIDGALLQTQALMSFFPPKTWWNAIKVTMVVEVGILTELGTSFKLQG